MVTLLILLILFVGAYAGYKNGVVLQLLQTIGYVVAFIFALDYYQMLSEYLYLLIPYSTPFAPAENPYLFYDESFMFSLDISYYHILSFLTLFIIGWVIVRFLTKFISYTVNQLRVPEPFNGIGGAVLGFIVNYLGVFIVLFFLTTIPFDMIQSQMTNSFIAENMVTSTPIVSKNAYQRFIVDVNQEALQEQPLMEIEPPAEETTEENSE